MISINSKKDAQTSYMNVDFGWYLNGVRAHSYQYSLDSTNYYPPSKTTVSSISGSQNSYTVTASNITHYYPPTVDAQYTDFDIGAGVAMIVNGTQWCFMQYEDISGDSFVNCRLYVNENQNADPSNFPSGSEIWDPRFYIYAAPLDEPVTFDCADSAHLGLPSVSYNGITPVEYIWDFGNGTKQYGGVGATTAQTTYSYNQAPPTVQVSLTVIDNIGQEHTGFHHLILLPQNIYD